MKPKHYSAKARVLALATVIGVLAAGCSSTGTRSSTVIDPPKPPGLPDPPAVSIPNPPGVEPPNTPVSTTVPETPTTTPPAPPVR